MKVNLEELQEALEHYGLTAVFEYKGIYGNINTYYYPKTKTERCCLYFNHKETWIDNPKDIMKTPFIYGKTIGEMADKLDYIEW